MLKLPAYFQTGSTGFSGFALVFLSSRTEERKLNPASPERNTPVTVLLLLQILFSKAAITSNKLSLCRRQIVVSQFLLGTERKQTDPVNPVNPVQTHSLFIRSIESSFKEASRSFLGGPSRSETSSFVCVIEGPSKKP